MIEFHERIITFQHLIHDEGITTHSLREFNKLIFDYYGVYRRSFPWREHIDPYHVVVSEVMLQQTQTARVEKKFLSFIQKFPTFYNLAETPLADVLLEWSGLGYNRRGIALQKIAQKIVKEHNGVLPNSPEILKTFPGLGVATASSIVAFTYNLPTIFIETNIRSVFIHCFFSKQEKVHDNEIKLLIEQTIDKEQPRDWYYALMDVGVFLKSLYPNPSRKSKHHIKQSKFEGSNRQLRSAILKTVLKMQECPLEFLYSLAPEKRDAIEKNISDLIKEGFFVKKDRMLCSVK